ncbi:hypothetical protein [Sulfuracidifex tepidarius]|uniref:Uncharacterized protein n=1 Tax=Sulfuracidifex tepidarius TaxID=1294262 RepID=A0A510DYW5_9CREN|nr:hypothetical protein [Sulfuracidifex tepidarius]BBG25128.1 hypothetical protein IC006_2463 [Sulfuracidifex tepidarius]BBG27915.1 hypothetical protein IC007_2470 [Sulfuracidifex tepidarius]
MGRSVVISVRIPEELKEELEKYEIDEAEIIRKALMNEVRRAKAKDLEREMEDVGRALSKIPPEEVVKEIREDREKR